MTWTSKNSKITPESLLKFATLAQRIDDPKDCASTLHVVTSSLAELALASSKKGLTINSQTAPGTLLKLRQKNKEAKKT